MAPYPPSQTFPLHARQASAATATVTVTVTSTPNSSSHGGSANLTGGAIAGIIIGSVIGAVIGVLLLIWIIRSCFNLGGPSPTPEIKPWYGRHEPTPHHRHNKHHRSPRSRRSSRSSSDLTLPPPPVVVRQEARSRGRRPSGSRNVYI